MIYHIVYVERFFLSRKKNTVRSFRSGDYCTQTVILDVENHLIYHNFERLHVERITGIFPAIVTPFQADNEIDESALRALVDRLVAEGVSGFYVGGSTGEAFLMSTDERKRVLELVADVVGDRTSVIAHVGSPSTRTAIELARHAQAKGVTAVSAVPPFYYKYSIDEILDYYRDIAASVQTPILLYNIPSLSGVTLDSENARPLLEDERVVGVKHTSMDLYELERMKQSFPRLSLLNGHDEVMLAGLSMGADGAVGSTFNIMAKLVIQIQKAFMAGRFAEADGLQHRVNAVIEVLKKVGVFRGVKYVLKLQGIDCGECRKPFRALSEAEKRMVEEVALKI